MKSKLGKSFSISSSQAESTVDNVSKKSFWEIGCYSIPLKRLEASFAFIGDLINMMEERSQIEAKCGKSLSEWSDKWAKYVQSQADPSLDDCVTYGTSKASIELFIESAMEKGRAHLENWTQIQVQCIDPLRNFIEENLHKSFNSLKETKEFREDFRTAQQPYVEALQKLKKARAKYYAVVDPNNRIASSTNECVDDEVVSTVFSNNKKQKQADKLRKRLEERIDQMELLLPHYQRKMTEVFDKCDEIESKKLLAIKKSLQALYQINCFDQNQWNQISLDLQKKAIESFDIENDLGTWSTNHGPKCKFDTLTLEGRTPALSSTKSQNTAVNSTTSTKSSEEAFCPIVPPPSCCTAP